MVFIFVIHSLSSLPKFEPFYCLGDICGSRSLMPLFRSNCWLLTRDRKGQLQWSVLHLLTWLSRWQVIAAPIALLLLGCDAAAAFVSLWRCFKCHQFHWYIAAVTGVFYPIYTRARVLCRADPLNLSPLSQCISNSWQIQVLPDLCETPLTVVSVDIASAVTLDDVKYIGRMFGKYSHIN